MTESIQHKLDRVRPPRVQITYDVEIGDAIEKKELPFIAAILANLSGKPEQPLPRLKDRKFVEIDRDNLEAVLKASKPRTTFQVENKLVKGGPPLNVALNFKSMDDFSPASIVEQIPALKKLFDARTQLKDLVSKLDGNDDLDALLQQVIQSTDDRQKVRAQLPPAIEAAQIKVRVRAVVDTMEDADEKAKFLKILNDNDTPDGLKTALKTATDAVTDADLKARLEKAVAGDTGAGVDALKAKLKEVIGTLSDDTLKTKLTGIVDGATDEADLKAKLKPEVDGMTDAALTEQKDKLTQLLA